MSLYTIVSLLHLVRIVPVLPCLALLTRVLRCARRERLGLPSGLAGFVREVVEDTLLQLSGGLCGAELGEKRIESERIGGGPARQAHPHQE